jgi:hypothetical protein
MSSSSPVSNVKRVPWPSSINTITGRIVGIGPDLVEVDAPFQPGNSGSPIIHLKSGKVVGLATYVIVRNQDLLTGRADAAPKIRRFGYRLDTITKWEPIDWKSFWAQQMQLEAIEKRTEDLTGFLVDLAKREPVGRHDNLAIRDRIESWFNARALMADPKKREAVDDSIRAFLTEACQSDMKDVQQRLTYDYFKRGFGDLQTPAMPPPRHLRK